MIRGREGEKCSKGVDKEDRKWRMGEKTREDEKL